jgi:hypothetical protein
MLVRQAQELGERVRRLALPESVKKSLATFEYDVGVLGRVVKGEHALLYQMLVLDTIMAPIHEAYVSSDAEQRSLVERAFLHLRRTLTVDEREREKWRNAFGLGEIRCEQLGALHLLLHGIYSFKADAGGGRTDLMLGDRLTIDAELRASAILALTEWKLVREASDARLLAIEGIRQAERYGSNEVAGFELRSARYVVLVSMSPLEAIPDESRGGVTYRVVNVAIEPGLPSVQARSRSRRR